MSKLATYILLDLAGIGCLISAFVLGGAPSQTTFVFVLLVGGAGIASVTMGALLIREEVTVRYRERVARASITRPGTGG